MKRFNYFVMSLISAAAFTFTACSSSDDLNGGGAGESKVDGFYMTLSVQAPTNGGSRTAENKDLEATIAESKVTSGTFFLVDANNKIVFRQFINSASTEDNYVGLLPADGKTGATTLRIKVENVVAGAKYNAYFLANAKEFEEGSTFDAAKHFTATEKFAKPYANDNAFVMFNQNDESVNGNNYTVTFTDDNKVETNPAVVTYGNTPNSPIKIERLAARIDEPTSNVTEIKPIKEGVEVTLAEKRAMEDAINKVESVKLTAYAISNAANKSYIMQNWNNDKNLVIPNTLTGFQYYQPTTEFGSPSKLENAEYFTTVTASSTNKDYVFENNAGTETANATAMYFEYTVTLKDMTAADFTDGTFYRYNNIIFKSFADIKKAYNDVAGLFEGKTPEELKDELAAAKVADDAEEELSKFRTKYDIEVFNEGKTYYKQVIKDQWINTENVIQRNSVYQLTVNNIFNVGAQVPNGEPDTDGMFYLDVKVSVNPWVLNVQNVDLK